MFREKARKLIRKSSRIVGLSSDIAYWSIVISVIYMLFLINIKEGHRRYE